MNIVAFILLMLSREVLCLLEHGARSDETLAFKIRATTSVEGWDD